MQNGLRSVRQELAFIPNREQTFLSLHLETNIFSRSLLSFFTEGAKNTWFDHSPVNFHKTDFCVRNQHDRTQNANFRATVGLVWGGSAHWRRRAMLRCCCLLMRGLVDAWKTLNCSCSLDRCHIDEVVFLTTPEVITSAGAQNPPVTRLCIDWPVHTVNIGSEPEGVMTFHLHLCHR